MRNIDQKTIYMMNYIIAFSNQNIDKEIRDKAKEYIINMQDYREIFDTMIYICKEMISLHNGDVEEIFNFLKQEYVLLEFDNYIKFSYLNYILFLSLRLSARNSYGAENIWNNINSEIDSLEDCDNQKLKNEIYYLCISIVNNFNIVKYDLEGTERLLEHCRNIDFDDFKIELLPTSILMI